MQEQQKPCLRRTVLWTAFVLAGLAVAPAVHAQVEPPSVNIAAQPLGAALDALAAQAKIKLLYSPDAVKGKTAPALTGRHAPEAALSRLLAGSGLIYMLSDGAYAIKPAPVVESVTRLAPIEVKAESDRGYTVKRAASATKVDTPLMETPVSVQTVTSEVISDRRHARLQEVLENVSGVLPVTTLGMDSRFMVRGFRQDRIYRDGLQSNGINAAFPTEYDIATVENIEVIKGPASVLYGRIEPGGLINVTTKKPQDTAQHSLDVSVGSFGFRRIEADSTGRLSDDGQFLYRMVAAVQQSDTFKDFGKDDRIIIAPSLTWRPSTATDFRVSMEYFQRDFQAEYGTPVIGDRPVNLPRERSFLDPSDPEDRTTRFQVGTDLNHRMNDNWTLRHRFLFGNLKSDTTFINPAPAFGNALQADGRTLNRNIFGQTSDSENYSTNLDLVGNLDLGATQHRVVLGVDYLQGRTHYPVFGDWMNPNPALAIDIYNPTYGIDPALFGAARNSYVFPANSHSVFKDSVFGVYLQDQVKVGENWHLLVGGRYDWARSGRGPGATEAAAEAAVPVRKDDAFSPRLAALYQFRPELSGYVSWSRSFGANNGINATGGTFDPQQGEQYELGLKTELFGRRLLGNVALYQLTKSNLLTADLSTADPNDSIAIGEQRARGVEIDISGRVTDYFSVIGSYTYTEAEVTKDNRGLQGHLINNVPKHALSLWGRYDLPSGLSFGLGGVAVDDRPGDIANTFVLPGYTRLDAMASYRFKLAGQALTAQLNVRNLLDKHYYESCDPSLNVAPRLGVAAGAPRTVTATVKMEF